MWEHILSSINWGVIAQILGIIAVVIPGWLAFLSQRQKNRIERRVANAEASSTTTESLIDTLKYKTELEAELRAQMDNMKQAHDMEMASLRQEVRDVHEMNKALEETLGKALARIEQLEWIEKAYRRLVKYTKALEKELTGLGVDWDTIDMTRVIQLTDWEGDEPPIPDFVDSEE